MPGTAYVYRLGRPKPATFRTDRPENEVDGDRFWVWVSADGSTAMLGFEERDGQAREAVAALVALKPSMADAVIDGNSPGFSEFRTLGEVAAAPARMFASPADHPAWFHGTSSTRVDAILAEGIRGDMEGDARSWDVADVPRGVVYMAADRSGAGEYARRAARLFGGEPVVVEVDGSALDARALRGDYDFDLGAEAGHGRAGGYGGVSAAALSLAHMRRVGHEGVVPATALVAVHALGRGGAPDPDAPSWEAPARSPGP